MKKTRSIRQPGVGPTTAGARHPGADPTRKFDDSALVKQWTGIEIEAARQNLEEAAALVLGRMLFAFSRLEFQMGLFLVWSDNGKKVDELAPEVAKLTLHKKLDRLKELVSARYADNREAHDMYLLWFRDAHDTRQLRNDLVHGRWGIEPVNGRVVNVVGLPTSPDQRTTSYTIEELTFHLENLEHLSEQLHVLRDKWPV